MQPRYAMSELMPDSCVPVVAGAAGLASVEGKRAWDWIESARARVIITRIDRSVIFGGL